MPTITPVNVGHTAVLLSQNRRRIDNQLPPERLIQIAKENPVVDTFLKLAVIPTPTIRPGHPKELEMRQNMSLVRDITDQLFKGLHPEVTSYVDDYGSLIIKVPGSEEHKNKQPLMFMGHLDVVPADLDEPTKQVYPTLINHSTKEGIKEYIASDGTTTLGADDKSLVAIIWDVVRRTINEPHVPYEIVLAIDEEEDGASLVNLKTSDFKSKHIIVADYDRAFQITFGCASFVIIKIDVDGLKGGHSGDDNQEMMVSATDILKELHDGIGNRVIKYFSDFAAPLLSKNIYEYEIARSASNKIPTEGHLYLSLRSNRQDLEDEEIKRIENEVKQIEQKHRSREQALSIQIKIDKQCPPWNGDPKSLLVKLLTQAANEIGHKEVKIAPEHGATQVNNLVGKKNQNGEDFIPVIVGVDSEHWHSTKENVSPRSMREVSNWLCKFVQIYSSTN
ncbi:MAG: M20/M25/M40 family metallo-hydrolase [Candidatus Melainabacteria bacterium]|nr:M20/M25/M40 family metallo-hydrolase [Candidatus Melainabacteria bacterium]